MNWKSPLTSLSLSLLTVLFFLIPLIWLPWTSELFEFPKMITTFILASLILTSLGLHILTTGLCPKFTLPFKIPLAIFLIVMMAATYYSINIHTSIWGYYSRFQGGLASLITYALLLAAISLLIKIYGNKARLQFLLTIIMTSLLVATYGILEHFGIDAHMWRQDVQARVFSTLGQPNWLAAYLTAVIPLTWAISISPLKFKFKNFVILAANLILFLCLLYTKSRSGLLAFGLSAIIFWTWQIWSQRQQIISQVCQFFILFVLLIAIVGTPITPSINQIVNHQSVETNDSSLPTEPGGTESGVIRQIVWIGAWRLGLRYPYLGTGLETFAYSYYWERPLAHNLVSEWDFLYNKAHNEYLNYLATTGFLGLGAYLLLSAGIVWYLALTIKKSSPLHSTLALGILASMAAIAVTNFFGFSVVIINLLFFTLPALVVPDTPITFFSHTKINRFTAFSSIIVFLFFLTTVFRIFFADLRFNVAKRLYADGGPADYIDSFQLIKQATAIYDQEPLYYDLASKIAADISLNFKQNNYTTEANQFRNEAIEDSDRAIELNPVHTSLWRSRAGVMMTLSSINQQDNDAAEKALLQNIKLATTDPKALYNLAILEARKKRLDLSIQYLTQSLQLKPDYTDALMARATYNYILSFNESQTAVANIEQLKVAITDLQNYMTLAPKDTDRAKDLTEWQQLLAATEKSQKK